MELTEERELLPECHEDYPSFIENNMIKSTASTICFALFLLIFSGKAYGLSCTGKVSNISIAQDGRVSVISPEIYPDGNGKDVCNTDIPFRGISLSVCRGWLGLLMAAKASNRTVTIQYTDSTYSCSTFPNWENALAPISVYIN